MDKGLGEIALILMSVRDQVKIFHWQTQSYSQHRASDKLVSKLTEQMDLFIETVQGSRRVRLTIPSNNTIVIDNQTSSSIMEVLETYKDWLIRPDGMTSYFGESATDLLAIRDDMLQTVNQIIYLFSLK